MLDLDRVVRCAVHPCVGIARVGKSSDAFFIAPEVPGHAVDPGPAGRFKDGQGRLKRQAARFRVYGYDAEGRCLGELRHPEVRVTWRVHVANLKAAWYAFENALDLGPLARPAQRRNAAVLGGARSDLVIDPGPRSIRGPAPEGAAARFDTGRFFGRPVYLGELRTDAAGRLLALGGLGASGSRTGARATTFANNDDWFDDVADGPVRATAEFSNRRLEADPGWLATTPPNFAPAVTGVVTMYDVLLDLFAREDGWPAPHRPAFWRDVRPILDRLAQLAGVNRGAFLLFGPGSPTDFADRALLARLADPGPDAAPARRALFDWFRAPGAAREDATAMPPLYGDAYGDFPDDLNIPERGLALTRLQHGWLERWAAGDFDPDPGLAPAPTASLEDLPAEGQPRALDRAHLESCLGGPFHPGIELTWPMRLRRLWREPFSLNVLPEGALPRLDWGETLTPALALAPDGPFAAAGPGLLTAFLGVPWQTDEASCDAGYEAGTYLSLPSFWAPRVPNHVLPERALERVLDKRLPVAQRHKHLNHRPHWWRVFGTDYLRRINDMVANWDELGVVVERTGPADHAAAGLPERLLVETELEGAFTVDDPTFVQVLRAEDAVEVVAVAAPGQTAGPAPPTAAAGPAARRDRRRRFRRDEM